MTTNTTVSTHSNLVTATIGGINTIDTATKISTTETSLDWLNIGDYGISYSVDGTASIICNKSEEKKPEVPEDTRTKIDIKNKNIFIKYYDKGFYKSEKLMMPDIKDVKVYDHTVVVVFADNTKTTAVLDPEDKFNLEQGISICLTKKLIGNDGSSIYNKLIKRALKVKKQNEDADRRAKEKKIEEKKHKELVVARKQKKKLKKREEEINMHKEAIIRAIKYFKGKDNKKCQCKHNK